MFKKFYSYMKENPEGYWFKNKWYGWGWTPATWQGWLTTILYIVLVLLFGLTIDENSSQKEFFLSFILPATLLTFTFLRICYKKGQKPRWSWGDPRKQKGADTAETSE